MANGPGGAQGAGGLLKEATLLKAASRWQEPSPQRHWLLPLVLVLTLVRGVLYMAVFPPWQHYDEPTHFEYVRLIAERGQLPRPGDYDLEMRWEIASSMQAAGFWKDQSTPSIAFWSDTPPSIGISELDHPPLYYALLALPQRLVSHQSVETQLYLARLGSVFLNLVVVASAYGLVTETFPRRRWLPLAVAAFITLLPPFTDLMSAVNNDAGAAATASLLLWASVRLVRRGPSPLQVGLTLLLAGACIATKSTSATVAVVILMALGVSYLPRSRRRWLWGGLALLIPVALAMTFTWGRCAAHWYSYGRHATANRVGVETPLGLSALALSADDDHQPRTVVQELSVSDGQRLRGHTVTLGAWLKAAGGTGGSVVLSLRDGRAQHWHQVQATTAWQFHAFTATIQTDALGVSAFVNIPKCEGAIQAVYVDGLVLADADMPVGLPPQFDTDQAATGYWSGQRFANLLKNGSAESTWPGLQPWLGRLSGYRIPASLVFQSLWDWSRTGWVYAPELLRLFQGFWGRFGWGHLALPSTYSYPLGLLTIAGIIGSGIGLVRRARSGRGEPWQRRAWAMFGLVLLVGWGGTILRIHPVFVVAHHLYWSAVRYAGTVIVPTATLLCLGLAQIVPRRWVKRAAYVGLLGMVALDALALWTLILPYYYG